ncbi:MAG: HEAT repeat domain-containing protein [Armatimonadota bacterium]
MVPSEATHLLTILLVAGTAGADEARAREPQVIVEALKSPDAAVRRRAQEDAAEVGARMVRPLCGLLAGDDPMHIRTAEGALFAVVADASRPGARQRRTAVVRALCRQLEGSDSPRVRAYVARLLGIVGGGEAAVAALKAALRDDAAAEPARRALVRIPGEGATRALLKALYEARPQERPPLILALGERGDPQAVKALTRFARRGREDVRIAALRALAQTGRHGAADAVSAAARRGPEDVRSAAVNALLALADAQRERRTKVARRLYWRAFANGVTSAQKCAALSGLTEVGHPKLAATLADALKDDKLSGTASRLLEKVRRPDVQRK